MLKTLIGALLVSLLFLFGPAPAQAATYHCSTYVPNLGKVYEGKVLKQLIPVGPDGRYSKSSQRCVGDYKWIKNKAMIQRWTVRRALPDGWSTVADNSERAYAPNNHLEVGVRKNCNTRSPSRRHRLVVTFTNGAGGGKSVLSMNELIVKC